MSYEQISGIGLISSFIELEFTYLRLCGMSQQNHNKMKESS